MSNRKSGLFSYIFTFDVLLVCGENTSLSCYKMEVLVVDQTSGSNYGKHTVNIVTQGKVKFSEYTDEITT